ncbi:thioredoxin-like protein [Globomyces pollinis-pini]|nr:thioredoxin-like protein [Globomyces pollinis-pini]
MESENIALFVQITGSDVKNAQDYLDFAGGDLDQAVTLFMESGSQSLTHLNNDNQNFSNDDMDDDVQIISENTRAPIPVVREVLNPSFQGITGQRIPFTSPLSALNAQGTESQTEDAVWSENNRLANLFQPPFDIMYTGSFDMARDMAQRKNKWLLVTIHDPSEFACQALNRDLWKDSSVKELIKKHFIFTQFNVNSPDGLEHRNYYPYHNYPYIAIIDPLTGERMKQWNLPIAPDTFVIEVKVFLLDHQPKVSESKPEKKKKDVTMLSEEEQLELAIQASMGNNSEAVDMDEDVKVVEEVSLPLDPVSKFKNIKAVQSVETTLPPAQSTRIQIRFPDGKRVVRKFEKVAKVVHIFEYIKSAYPTESEKPFDLFNVRDSLLQHLDLTLVEAKVEGCSLTLDYI